MLIEIYQHISILKELQLRSAIVEVGYEVSEKIWSRANKKPRRWTTYIIAILKIEEFKNPPPVGENFMRGGALCHLPTPTSGTLNLLYFGPQRQKSNKLDSPLN